MRRRHVLLLSLVLAASTFAAASARHRRGGPHHAPKRVLEKVSGPLSLVVESVDVDAARAVVLVGGVSREPDARLFTFHDDRDHHFIAEAASCAPAEQPSLMRCTLELPRPYLRKRVVGATVHLHGKEVEAPAARVEALFSDARAHAHLDGGVGHGTHFADRSWAPPLTDGGVVHEDTEEWRELKDKDRDDTEEWKELRGR